MMEEPWIEHAGGERPVDPDTMIDIRLHWDRVALGYLQRHNERAGDYSWERNSSDARNGHIIAYRPHNL